MDDDDSTLLDHCYDLQLSSRPVRPGGSAKPPLSGWPDREDADSMVALGSEFHERTRGQDSEDSSAPDPVLAR